MSFLLILMLTQANPINYIQPNCVPKNVKILLMCHLHVHVILFDFNVHSSKSRQLHSKQIVLLKAHNFVNVKIF